MDWLSPLTSVLNMVGQYYTNKQQMDFNSAEAEKQRNWSEQQTANQNAWNFAQWQRENEYNSAAAQVQRLRDAGLNPLYYGIDGVAAAPLQSAQPLGYERANAGNLQNPVSAGIDSAVRVAQISNIQANTAKTNNENLTETQRRENMQVEFENLKQDLQNKLVQEGLDNVRREQIEKEISWIDRLNSAVIAVNESKVRLNESTRNRIDVLLKGEKILQAKSIEDFEYRWSKIDAEIDKLVAETDLSKEDLANYALNHLQSGFMGTGISVSNLFREFVSKRRDRPKMKGYSSVR